MTKIYKFQDQLKVGKIGEAKLDKFFKEIIGMTIEYATKKQELSMGIDRIFSKNGRECYVEYKTDEKAVQTGNLFIETLSNSKNCKLGWVLTSQADRIVILVGSTIYLMKLSELKEHIKTKGMKYRIGYSHNPTYMSEGRLMPIKDLVNIKSLREYTLGE